MNKNPKHQRRQGYTPKGAKPYGYSASSTTTGSNGKSNSAGKTPKVSAKPYGDSTATYGKIYPNN